jgi:spore coat polysaccharide biosynthesis protein SpsF (cytidylyltransferase family)
MTKVVGVIQARLTSIRLARKAILPLVGRPVMHHLFDRALQIKGLDDLVLAIPTGEANDPLVDATEAYPHPIKVVRGPDDDLTTRFLMAADLTGADVLVRMWGDCPVTDPGLADGLLQAFTEAGVSWADYPNDSGYPEGVETHILRVEALRRLIDETDDANDREGIIDYFRLHADRFPALSIYRKPDRSHLKCLLDTEGDYRRITEIFETLYPENPLFGISELEALADQRPDLFSHTENATGTGTGG